MTNKYTGGFAFPQHTMEPNPNGGEPRIVWQEGMTLRDYFAAKAMHAYMTDTQIAWTDSTFEKAADAAYRLADAMLEARND